MVNIDYASLKAMIHFKHVFLVGDVATDFESNDFIKLAMGILGEEMKPFSLFLHRFK